MRDLREKPCKVVVEGHGVRSARRVSKDVPSIVLHAGKDTFTAEITFTRTFLHCLQNKFAHVVMSIPNKHSKSLGSLSQLALILGRVWEATNGPFKGKKEIDADIYDRETV